MILIPQYRTARRASAPPAVGAISFLQATGDAANASTYTFASQNIGTAASDRTIIVAIHWRAVVLPSISSVTVAGVSASVVTSGSNASSGVALYAASVPTGTSGSIVVTFSAASLRCIIGAWRATGIAGSALDTGSATGASASISIDVEADGICIAAATTSGAGGSMTWTNITENYDTNATEATVSSGASLATTATETRTISNTIANTEPVTIAASWSHA